ncbi:MULTISPECIES: hydroxymethylglutaryl-CoA lyase [Sphingobium]|uniref:Hydroxymethylglutaryl-CoA lyase n=1 Tax=Sphingobium fuliginis (strain ATCC 27551) TaxID=336203 RepID=A0A292ZI92_SPHSA|nr:MULTISPECIES: hydroxymethylglutaryl-CoA lyase [Sphingobium]PNQ03714.1 hydroxymethylglutaryl-CoA lyase [Sphingobium sp. SA916]QOT71759.1 hydroxymethylglutaryl-CoA lyase [Sphingobium fuliginis]GAY22559.1 hydroxymethylglutaryl-CoA lyase [Sphingobium fuliginis]
MDPVVIRPVVIREVGLRDGLQMLAAGPTTGQKQAWIDAERAAGLREMEVCSFVPATLMPQFADAADIVRYARGVEGLTVTALAPNLRGAQLAAEAGVDKINFVISVSESHNLANVRRTPHESIGQLREIVAMLASLPPDGRPGIDVGLSTAFGCSIEGRVDPEATLRLAEEVAAAGVDGITIADTVGYADPIAVAGLSAAMLERFADLPIAIHLHDTRGLALANAFSAYRAGIRIFDGSLGGLGGCPHAPGATGNVAIEDLIFMFELMGVDTGIDLARLLAARSAVAAMLPPGALGGQLARAGLPKTMRVAS